MIQARWTWAGASCRGVSHERANIRLQDAFTCSNSEQPNRPITIVVSDGAGSATLGGEGAALACRTISVYARQHFSTTLSLPDDDTLHSWVDATRDRIFAAAGRRAVQPRDFAATLLLVISDGTNAVTLHVGDGCAVLYEAKRGVWMATTWPDHGEYASTTFFVTDEPSARVRITRHTGDFTAIAAFSDGLERLVLNLQSHEVHVPFFERIIAPVRNSALSGKDRDLCKGLAGFLCSEDVNARTDDDKTLVLAVRR